MHINNVKDLIKKALLYYDKQYEKYYMYTSTACTLQFLSNNDIILTTFLKNENIYLNDESDRKNDSKHKNEENNHKNEEKKHYEDIIPFNSNELIAKYEILGVYDHTTQIWLWSWLIPDFAQDDTKLSRELLNYGLKLEPGTNVDIHFYLKVQLLNSRILFENNIELDIHLAIISYLLKDKCLFIFPVNKKYDDKTIYQTIYYIIK